MLHSAPSFSVFNCTDESESEGGMNQEEGQGGEREELLRSVSIGKSIGSPGNVEFSFEEMCMIDKVDEAVEGEEEEEEEEEEKLGGFEKLGINEEGEIPVSPRMYLATGLGIDGACFDDDLRFKRANVDEIGGDEDYYKRMVDEYPCQPLVLRNYALLLQSKGDLHAAEDYYYRATLADPGDGEIMLQYAKLVWELHRDQDGALTYFERAAQAAPEDSNVLAAYASFLWELVEAEEKDSAQQSHIQSEEENDMVGSSGGTGGSDITVSDSSKDCNIEDYLKKMVEENPCNPLFLRNYAQFLHKSKGDLHKAEEYYSRAILAEPGNGEILLQFANLVWEQHHDREKAVSYLEQAVQATPGDSNILAAYASFLWETDEDEEKPVGQDQEHNQGPVLQGVTTS